jgi:hypothetical protein
MLSDLGGKSHLASDHVGITQSLEGNPAGSECGIGSTQAFVPPAQAGHGPEHIHASVWSCQAKHGLTPGPSGLQSDRTPRILSRAPGSIKVGHCGFAAVEVVRRILNPEINVECQYRLMPQQEIHASDQKVFHSVAVHGVENMINIH